MSALLTKIKYKVIDKLPKKSELIRYINVGLDNVINVQNDLSFLQV